MIPWVREKFAERRARWVASRKRSNNNACFPSGNETYSTSNNISEINSSIHTDDKRHITSKLRSSTNVQNIDENEDINVIILSPTGRVVDLCIPKTSKIFDIKTKALEKFSDDSTALPFYATDVRQLYPKYRLVRPESLIRFNESLTLTQAGILNNETLLLDVRRTKLSNIGNIHAPTADEIAAATKDVPINRKHIKKVDINELVLQSDIQFDVRKVIISLAQESAYIIGAGPYATSLILMLKQKLSNKRKHQNDTIQRFIEMGFEETKARYAVKLHRGVYSTALEWLIAHQEDELIISLSSAQLSTTALEKDFQIGNVRSNIESLLEIVLIYSHEEIAPSADAVRTFTEMGFNEKEALNALGKTRNNQAAACEWLCGNRSTSLMELTEGLSHDSPILKAIMASPQIQMSLSHPKIFLAYLSILENQNVLSMWLSDNDTSSLISHVLRKYHEEKHILGINQFNSSR